MNDRLVDRLRSGFEAGFSRRTVVLGMAGTVAAAAVLRPGNAVKADSGDVNPDVMQWSDYIHGASSWSGVPAYLLAGLIDVESGGDRWLVSDAGALGLTQIMPWWFDDLGVDLDRWPEPDVNVELGSTILAQMYDGDDWSGALASYFGNGCDDYGSCTDDYVALVLNRASVYGSVF
jgi:soluble lytic murein transglycosylase-like protein